MSERFQLCELLGAGSTGKVYRARDEELGKDVALKMLRRPDLVEDRLQLKEEFRSVAGILHPNLVELYELVVEPERSFFTMELLDGAPYSDVAQRRGIEQVDSGRFADELRQMVLGLSALHAGGCVHRDIKPSNVFLTRSGRVVIVDFGLSAGRRVPSGSKRREIAGTLAYVAPEVLWGEPCTTASDLYGLGALAYEALSGSPPFQGHPVEILDRKMRGELEPIRAIRPDLDTKVGDLVMSLLDPKQQERPTATEVLAVLDALAPAEIAPRRAPVVFRDSPFVGRELELGQFSQAAARASEEGLQVVSLSGPSGIGKSELLKRAVGQLVETHLVLFGRCHPFESVPYNAFDAVVDQLATALWASERSIAAPAHVGALRRLFPALERVFPAGSDADEESVDPVRARALGLSAFFELLGEEARRQPIVLCIDDSELGDGDSALLFVELLRVLREAPILVVLAFRTENKKASAFLGTVERAIGALGDDKVHVELSGLTSAEAKSLVLAIVGSAPANVSRIVEESGGSPFFASQLAERSVEGKSASDLDELLADRIASLSNAERAILEVASIGLSANDQRTVIEAAGLGASARVDVARLIHTRLLRAVTRQALVEVYHDRIRLAALGKLPEQRMRRHHLALADALARRSEPDPDVLFEHYSRGGATAKAVEQAMAAVDRAVRSMAFDHAARRLEQLLELPSTDLHPRHRLLERLAWVLVYAGRGIAGAQRFEEAAAALPLSSEEGRRIELERKAAEQYLASGEVVRGTALLQKALEALGLKYPRTPKRALLSLLAERMRLELRGFDVKRPNDWAAIDRRRTDLLWSAGLGMGWIDQLRTAEIQARFTRLALDGGEPTRVALALGTEASQLAANGGIAKQKKSDEVMARARAAAAELDQRRAPSETDLVGPSYVTAFLDLMTGSVSFYRAHWLDCQSECHRAEVEFRDRCLGTAFEINMARLLRVASLVQTGRFDEVEELVGAYVREARERGDVFAEAALSTGVPSTLWLAKDRPDEAFRAAERARLTWSATEFQVQHYFDLLATAQASLYVGQPERAQSAVEYMWPRIEKSFILRVEHLRIMMFHLRARTHLAFAQVARHPRRELHLARAMADATRLSREVAPWASALARAIRAGALGAVRPEAALRSFAQVATELEGLGMRSHAAAARMRSELTPSPSSSASQALLSHGIRDPRRMADMLMPAVV